MTIELGVLLTISSIVIAFMGFKINKQKHNLDERKHVKEEASKSAVLSTKLDHIHSGIEDIKLEVKSTKEQTFQLIKEQVRLEESVKSAHKRIDKLEGK